MDAGNACLAGLMLALLGPTAAGEVTASFLVFLNFDIILDRLFHGCSQIMCHLPLPS